MRGIIFDCDGVLVDSEEAHFLSWQKVLQEHNIVWDKKSHTQFCGYPGKEIAQKLALKFDLKSPEKLLEKKRELFRIHQSKGFSPMPYGVSFLRKLFQNRKHLNIKLGLASGARRQEIFHNLKHLGIFEMFDAIVSGYDDLTHISDPEGTNKPKPYIYLHTAHLLGLTPSVCVAIEDSYPGLMAATQAQMTSVALPNAFTEAQDFSQATFTLPPNCEIDLESFFHKISATV